MLGSADRSTIMSNRGDIQRAGQKSRHRRSKIQHLHIYSDAYIEQPVWHVKNDNDLFLAENTCTGGIDRNPWPLPFRLCLCSCSLSRQSRDFMMTRSQKFKSKPSNVPVDVDRSLEMTDRFNGPSSGQILVHILGILPDSHFPSHQLLSFLPVKLRYIDSSRLRLVSQTAACLMVKAIERSKRWRMLRSFYHRFNLKGLISLARSKAFFFPYVGCENFSVFVGCYRSLTNETP